MFYKRIRPKFFASEPSSVTFCYTLFAFIWLVVSQWRHKIPAYLALAAVGMFAMPGPTLLLMVLLILPYMLFLASRVGGRLSGRKVARVVFERVGARCELLVADGARLEHGAVVANIEGSTRAVLAAERTALNFLQRLSGVATLTAKFVAAVAETKARICDTRKTAPGWRALDKAAVRAGGGSNHRVDLGSGILIKDNHVAAMTICRPDGVTTRCHRSLSARDAPLFRCRLLSIHHFSGAPFLPASEQDA